MASFGSFTFAATEAPLYGSYLDWENNPAYSLMRPLGANRDDVVLMGVGSGKLGLDLRMSKSRFETARALIGTTATYTDWDGTSRTALVENVRCVRYVLGELSGSDDDRVYFVHWDLREV